MTPTNMSDGGASGYLRVFCNEDGGGTWNHSQAPFFGGNLQCFSFLLGVLAEMASHVFFMSSMLLASSVDLFFPMSCFFQKRGRFLQDFCTEGLFGVILRLFSKNI